MLFVYKKSSMTSPANKEIAFDYQHFDQGKCNFVRNILPDWLSCVLLVEAGNRLKLFKFLCEQALIVGWIAQKELVQWFALNMLQKRHSVYPVHLFICIFLYFMYLIAFSAIRLLVDSNLLKYMQVYVYALLLCPQKFIYQEQWNIILWFPICVKNKIWDFVKCCL